MNLFINFSPLAGYSVNTYRNPNGYANNDVLGFVDDVFNGVDSSCPLEGAREALEDGSLWAGQGHMQETIEGVHDFLVRAQELELEAEFDAEDAELYFGFGCSE